MKKVFIVTDKDYTMSEFYNNYISSLIDSNILEGFSVEIFFLEKILEQGLYIAVANPVQKNIGYVRRVNVDSISNLSAIFEKPFEFSIKKKELDTILTKITNKDKNNLLEIMENLEAYEACAIIKSNIDNNGEN